MQVAAAEQNFNILPVVNVQQDQWNLAVMDSGMAAKAVGADTIMPKEQQIVLFGDVAEQHVVVCTDYSRITVIYLKVRSQNDTRGTIFTLCAAAAHADLIFHKTAAVTIAALFNGLLVSTT